MKVLTKKQSTKRDNWYNINKNSARRKAAEIMETILEYLPDNMQEIFDGETWYEVEDKITQIIKPLKY